MTVKTAKGRPGLAGMEAFFVIDQSRSSANWPLAKILQHYSNAETGFNHFVIIRHNQIIKLLRILVLYSKSRILLV